LDPARVVETADVAVLQPQEGPEASWARVKGFSGGSFEKGTPIVGLTPLKWTYKANRVTPYSNYESYVREMVKLADQLVKTYGVKIGFYPTNFPENGCREDDVTVCREIRDQMADPGAAFVADKLTSPGEFKGMVALSQVNIVTRMHACILSTGAGVPTLSINYLFKLGEYMESLGLKDFSVDIEEFQAETVLKAFDRMWTDRKGWAKRTEEAMERKRESLKAALKRMGKVEPS
jgi:polysaccharide pyruvyl transferase WcaK-like protein